MTAAFNRNLLARINRELAGDFDLSRFERVALYNAGERRTEMHLRPMETQTVDIEESSYTFRSDETLWTECCHKYARDEPLEMASRTGSECVMQWVDDEWGFAENLFVAV